MKHGPFPIRGCVRYRPWKPFRFLLDFFHAHAYKKCGIQKAVHEAVTKLLSSCADATLAIVRGLGAHTGLNLVLMAMTRRDSWRDKGSDMSNIIIISQ